jgi:hypothetical protein
LRYAKWGSAVSLQRNNFEAPMSALGQKRTSEDIRAGGFMHMPKGMQHFGWFTEATIIRFHGMGPQSITYVNPADDPRKSN